MNEEKDIFDFIEKRKVDIPDKAYFDNLAQSVIDSQKTKIIPLYKHPIVWIASTAAAVLILFTVNFNPTEPPAVSNQQEWTSLSDVPQEELLAYVENNIEDFDVEMIAEIVPTKQLNAQYEKLKSEMTQEETIDPIESITLDNITKEDIIEYLNDEDLDFSDLDNEDSFI